jgi:hypothetical protein
VADLIDEATYYPIAVRMCLELPCEVLVGVTWRVVRVRRVPVCVPVCACAPARARKRETPQNPAGSIWSDMGEGLLWCF